MFGQQKHAFIFSIFLAVISVSSNAFAKTGRDGYPYNQTGAYRQIASLQETVVEPAIEKTIGPKRTYFEETAAQSVCDYGCDTRGENGQSKLVKVKVMGRDDRNDPAAYLGNLPQEEQNAYSNVGQIECPLANKRIYVTTGWLIGSRDTLGTIAHTFVDPNTNKKIDPAACKFILRDVNGKILDTIQVRYARSRYDNPANYNDKSQDLAVVKLMRPVGVQVMGPRLGIASDLNNIPVKLVAYHFDVNDPNDIRVTHGRLYSMIPNSRIDSATARVSDSKRLFVTSYDSNHGSSGGMIIDESNGMIIGVHVGSNSESISGEFNQANNFNYGVYIDREFVSTVKAVVADQSPR